MRHAPAPALSRTGRRSENEDAVWLRSTTDSSGRSISVLAVADGMGGHTHGAKASEIAIRGVQDAVEGWMDSSDSLDEDQLRINCRQLFGRIDQAIEIYTDEHPDAEGMGTTLVLAVVLEDQACVAHIGDSRAYWVSPDETADQLTLDHSAAAEAVREGRMTEAEVAGSAFQHALTRSLDGSGDSDPDFGVHSIEEPGFLVLCSDGLSGTIEDERLAQELLRKAPLAETAEALVDAAFEQGSEDNISLAVLECGAVERKESAAAVVPPSSGSSSARQPPADQPSSSELAAPEARPPESPVRDTSPEQSASANTGAPRWASALLGVLVVALLGLGGWADYQYGLVGLFPEGTASGGASLTLPDSIEGDSTGLRASVSSESNAEPSYAQADSSTPAAAEEPPGPPSEEEDTSSQGQTEDQAPVDIAKNTDEGEETESDETPEEGESASARESQTDGDGAVDSAGGQEGEGAPANGPSEENGNPSYLQKKSVPPIPGETSADRTIPHDAFDPATHRIERVEGAAKVGTDIELSSGARLIVEPKGRFPYDPNGAFKALDAGDEATDEFTYTAASESGDQKLRGTVEIPIRGENTPPELKGTGELTVGAGQVSPVPSRALTATDPDDGAEELRFTVTKGPTRGEIRVGDGSATASAASSFTQRDIEEGRVFYADTTGEAGEDAFTVAVKDEDGAGPESESFRVKIEPAETQKTQNTSSDTEGECRIQFASQQKEPDKPVGVEDFPRAEELEKTTDLTVKELTVEEYTTDGEERFGLFLKRSGREDKMKAKLEEMEDVPDCAEEDVPKCAFVHCF